MTFPTPSGQLPGIAGLTQQGLPNGWQNKPTTDASESATVAIVAARYGQASQFKAWYDAARRKDPKITPAQAATAFVVGDGTATGVATAGNFLTGGTADISSGGGDGTPVVGLGSVSGSPGVGQAAAGAAAGAAASLTNPLDALAGIASALRAFYDEVTNIRVWVSLGWLGIGAIMLLSGVWLFASHYGVVPSPAKLGKAALL